jgi:8-amino-7-oxononanoate synthase
MSWLDPFLQERLGRLKQDNLLRRLRIVERVDGPWVTIEGKRRLCFCSNDYLGLSQVLKEPEEVSGTGGSRLLCGTLPEHVELERRMARFKGFEAGLLFNSAYLANLGLISSIADASTTIFSDELNHASLIDAIRLSKAKIEIYPHHDVKALKSRMQQAPGRKIIVTESLFSMDGDYAPMQDLQRLAESMDAVLVVDDTHATGIYTEKEVGDVQVCNLAKAGGLLGGFVLGSRALIDLLTTTARTMVYTTSLPAGLCRAGIRAIEALENAHAAREKLRENIRRFAAGLRHKGIPAKEYGPIFPIMVGKTEAALAAAERLWEAGFFLPAIRPPTVPEGTARLRVSITALHEPEHIDSLLSHL